MGEGGDGTDGVECRGLRRVRDWGKRDRKMKSRSRGGREKVERKKLRRKR